MDENQINTEELDPSAMIVEEDEHEVDADAAIDPLLDPDADIDPITGEPKKKDEDEEGDEEFEAYMFGDKYEEM